MRILENEQRLKQQIRMIDTELTAVQRSAALDGLDLRSEWDTLIGRRVELAQRLIKLRDGQFATLKPVLFLSVPMALFAAMLYASQARYPAALAIGFVVGFIGTVGCATLRARRLTNAWESAYTLQIDATP